MTGSRAAYQTAFRDGERLMGLPEVMEMVGLSRSRIYVLMIDEDFPRPIKTGKHRVAWIHSELVHYINRKIAERNETFCPAKGEKS